MSSIIYQMWIVFLLGAIGIWKAIPVGLVLKAHPALIIVMTIFGAFAGILTLFFLGSRTKAWVLRRMSKKGHSKKSGKVNQLLDKYGVIGLGIFGTLIIGHIMTMALGMVVVNSEKKLLFWTSIGIVIWTVALTIIGTYSIDLFNELLM